MECPTKTGQGPDLFLAYVAGNLPSAARLALERHFRVCPGCRGLVEAQQQVWSALDSWEPQHISTDFNRKLYARIAAEDARPWYRRVRSLNWSLRPALPVAAACAVVFAGYLLREPLTAPDTSPRIAVEHRIDMEQVERALDDIEMLKQMGVGTPD